MNKSNLPNNLYEIRRGAGLSQEEFAEKLGVSRQAVSKWERGEAYPDTENLIVISEMFGVTIDELLRSENISSDTKGEKAEESSDEEPHDGSFRVKVGDKVNLNLSGAITVDDDDTTVKIDLDKGDILVDDEDGQVKVNLGKSGIVVNSDDGVNVKLGKGGITINDNDSDDDDDDEEDKARKASKLSIFYKIPYPIVATIAFLAIGLLADGWYWAWTLFMTIPLYYSLLDSIRRKRFTEFAYPVFLAFIYCLFGMLFTWWHPGWLIFVTIPVYYPIAEGIDRYIRNKNN